MPYKYGFHGEKAYTFNKPEWQVEDDERVDSNIERYQKYVSAGMDPALIAANMGQMQMAPYMGQQAKQTQLMSLLDKFGGMFGKGGGAQEPQYQAPQQQQTTLADLLAALKQNQPQQMDLSSLMRPMQGGYGQQQRQPITNRYQLPG